MTTFELRSIGRVVSSLVDPTIAPRQPDEGAPPATLEFIDGPRVRVRNLEALDGTPIVDVKPLIGEVNER